MIRLPLNPYIDLEMAFDINKNGGLFRQSVPWRDPFLILVIS